MQRIEDTKNLEKLDRTEAVWIFEIWLMRNKLGPDVSREVLV